MSQPNGMAPRGRHVKTVWMAAALAVVLAAVSLMVRLPRLNVFITPDELKWVCRSINFYRGLGDGNLAQTRQTGHPGVMTMWLGVPFMEVDLEQPWLEACLNPSISDIIEEQGVARPQELGAYLFRARRSVVWFTSLCLGISMLLLARLFGLRVAGLAGVLLALDPFMVAHARLLHLDAITTHLLFLSVLLLLMARRKGRWHWWALAGVAGGLAMLNKSPAMFVAPFVGLVLGLDWLLGRRPLSAQVKHLALWAAGGVGAYLLCWPAMWVQPVETLRLVLNTAFFYASNPHANSNYFWGAPRPDPGPAFYPVALAFRLTPLSSLGLLLGLPWLARKHARRPELWIAAGFVALYGLFMTIGQKKFDRYLLPVLPFVELIAAVGLWGAVDWLTGLGRQQRRRLVRFALTLLLAVAVGLTGLGVLARAPYYLTYYNPLLGGIRAATKVLLVGWGEGLEQAAAFLNGVQSDQPLVASSRALPDFAPFYDGIAVHESNYDPATVSYVVMYLNEVQRRLEPAMLERYYDVAIPVHVVQLGGVDYAWVYRNRTAEPVIALLHEKGDPGGDAILVSRPALFTTQYDGELPVYTVSPDATQAEVIAQLEQLRAAYERIWYVSYWEKNPNPLTDWVALQLRTHGLPCESAAFTDITVSLWELSHEVSFASVGPTVETDLLFGAALALDSYQLAPESARWGSGTGLNLEWRVTQDIGRYYSLYVHILDDQGRRWGQGDAWLVDQSLRPAVEWRVGETVSQLVPIELAPGIMPGRYSMVLGLRDRLGDDHPEARRASGEALGLEVALGEMEVLSSPWNAMDQLAPAHAQVIALGEGLSLLGWGELPGAMYLGDKADVALYWRADEGGRTDLDVALRLVDGADEILAAMRRPVGSTAYGTSQWRTGEALWAVYPLDVPADVLNAAARWQVQLLDASGAPRGVAVDLGPVSVRGLQPTEPQVAHPQPAMLGDDIAFLGYDVTAQARSGGVIDLTLYWQAQGEIATSYTVFTHMLDAHGGMQGQMDGAPLAGRRPTNTWRRGEYIVDHYAIEVKDDAPPGEYRLAIGMYDAAADFQRAALLVAGERQPDDRLLLDLPVQIGPRSD
jgi:hypothetical protein